MKKLLCVLLSLTLLLGVFGAFASASPVRYVVLGDSIAYGSGLSNPREAVYGRIVADTNGYVYENYAVPGHTTSNLLRRLEEPQVKEAVKNADIVNISIGGNNFLLGDLNGILYNGIVKEDYRRLDEIAEGLYTDLGRIVDAIRAVNTHAVIVLQTLYNPQTGAVGEVYAQGAQRLNETFRAFEKDRPGEILIADVAAALTDSDLDFAEDRIHPSAAGNEKIARVVLETLYENGLGASTEPVIAAEGRDARGTGVFTFFVKIYGAFFRMLRMVRNLLSFGR